MDATWVRRILSADSNGGVVLRIRVVWLMAGILCGQSIGFAAASPDDGNGPAQPRVITRPPRPASRKPQPLALLPQGQARQPPGGAQLRLRGFRGTLSAEASIGAGRAAAALQHPTNFRQRDGRRRGYAELSIQFRILVRDDQWVRVPLRLDQAVLRAAPECQGPGEQFVHFENDGEGYVAWLHGAGRLWAPNRDEDARAAGEPLATKRGGSCCFRGRPPRN